MSSAMRPFLWYVKSMGWLGRAVTVVGLVLLTEPAYALCKSVLKKITQCEFKSHICEVYFINRRINANPARNEDSHYFEHCDRIISYIDRAEKSICVSMYTLTVRGISEAIIRAAKERNVVVRVISCKTFMYRSNSQFLYMMDAGISVRCCIEEEHIMHHKFCVIDANWLCAKCLVKNHFKQYGEYSQNMHYTTFDKAALSDMPKLLKLFGDSCSRCNRKKVSYAPKAKTNPLPANGILINGSCNWTNPGLMFNRENIIFTSMPSLVDSFSMEFQRSWYEAAS